MLLITTALMLEARPIRDQLGLESIPGLPYAVFEGNDKMLIVTGTGSLRASAATGWALGRYPGFSAALNVGFAGAADRVAPLYQWRHINAIKDQATRRVYVPDILWSHPFKEAPLLTVGEVVRSDIGWEGLVDMEGSGFYEAARSGLSPDRIALLKWVSDSLTGSIDVADTKARFSAAIQDVVEFIEAWPVPESREAGRVDSSLLELVRERLRLTRTQETFIGKWIRGYSARGGDPERVRACLPETVPIHKTANTRIFETLKNVLKG